MRFLFTQLDNIVEFMVGEEETKVIAVGKFIVGLFVRVLDEEATMVYSWMARRYFKEGHRFENTMIYGEINNFLKEQYGFIWASQKIDDTLGKLEEAGVIEWSDGYVRAIDEIYFGQ